MKGGTMEGGTVSRNTARGIGAAGGGVYVGHPASTFTMEGGTISGNTAEGGRFSIFNPDRGDYNYGGGVYLEYSTFRKSGNSIIYGKEAILPLLRNTVETGFGDLVGKGHAVYLSSDKNGYYRNSSLLEGEDINTTKTDGWTKD